MGNYPRIVLSMNTDKQEENIFAVYCDFAQKSLDDENAALLEHTKEALSKIMVMQESQKSLLDQRYEQDIIIIRGAELINTIIQTYSAVVSESFLTLCKEHVESLGLS
jgi:hypothetical protein